MKHDYVRVSVIPKRAFVFAAFAAAIVCGCRERGYQEGGIDPAAFHAQKLAEGDLRVLASGVPYHLERLVELGASRSSPFLLEMLNDTTATPLVCVGDGVLFWGSASTTDPSSIRPATMGDLADWALRMLYHMQRGVGYRGNLPEHEREKAILRWREVVATVPGDEGQNQVHRDQNQSDDVFPSVPKAGTP